MHQLGVFNDEIPTCREEITRKVCEDFEAELKAFNGERNHVRPLVHYPPKVAVPKLVNSLKGVSARRIRQECTVRIDRAIMHGHLRSPSHFSASCGGAPLATVRHRAAETPALKCTSEQS